MSDSPDRPYQMDVIIPMRDSHGLTRNLARQIAVQGEADRLWVYDNGSENQSSRNWLETLEETGRYGAQVIRWGPAKGLYRLWNDAWRRSLQTWEENRDRPVYLAVLNNDLIIPDGFLRSLGDALWDAEDDVWITYPHWKLGWPSESTPDGTLTRTGGTRNVGGMSGYAFLLDVRRHVTDGLPLIDEGFIWLSGDGDLVTQVQSHGAFAARVNGLPVGHLEKASSARHQWTRDQGARDMKRFREKYHGTRH